MSTVPLRSQPVGSLLTLNVGGSAKTFIIVHQGKPAEMYDDSCDGTWLLMQDVYTSMRFSSDLSEYANSDLHSYLNRTFPALLDAEVQKLLQEVKIPYCPDCDSPVSSGADGLAAKAFLLSLRELGIDDGFNCPDDGAKLDYFEAGKTASAVQKRIAMRSGTAVEWWTRSLFAAQDDASYTIRASGTYTNKTCGWTGGGVRPALILPATAMLREDGTLVANSPPAAPASITLPKVIHGGGTAEIFWEAAADPDDNLSGYLLERSADGGATFAQVYKGSALRFTDTLVSGWNRVQYRVSAYDACGAQSGYTLSEECILQYNSAPVIAGQTASGTDLGGKSGAFALQYTVTDADDDDVTVQEYIDSRLKRSFTAALGAANTFDVTDADLALLADDETHTLKVTAGDGKAESEPYTVTFRKEAAPEPELREASFTLRTPLPADTRIRALRLTVRGSFPQDSTLTVLVSNNANDDAPVYEDATAAVQNAQDFLFTNRTAARGFALNFRISAARGESGTGGWFSGVEGAYLTEPSARGEEARA